LDYSLSVGVYDQGALADLDLLDQAGAPAGKRYELASVTLDPASGRGSKHVSREKLGLDLLDEPRAVAEGLTLLSFGQIPDSVSRGGPVGVLLEWRSDADVALPDYWPELRLVRDGLVVAATEHGPVDDLYPTSWWQPGETVLDWWSLMVPPEIESGDAQLEICVRGNEPVVLQHVEVEQVVRVFQPPSPQYAVSMSLGDVAELVGYDLDAEVLAPGQE